MLRRSDIVGRVIRLVRQRVQPRALGGRFDVGRTWFTLDTGVSFALPRSDAGASFEEEEVPPEARELTTDRLIGRRIVEVWRALHEGRPAGHESAVLELEGGLLLAESNVAPHEANAVGLYAFTRDEWARLETELAPFWG